MTIKKGSRVKYRIGRGWSLGKVLSVKDGKAVIKTETGAEISRSVDGLVSPDAKAEEAEPAPKAAPQPPPDEEDDDEGDDYFDSELEDDEDE